MTTEINWGYNCLTRGVHHGRPEAIWNIPLIQAVHMYKRDELKELILARIYNDAMQYVKFGAELRPSTSWAERVREIAEEKYDNRLQHKVGEISNYYKSPQFHRDVEGIIVRVIDDRLNPHYAPLHDHDSLNMFCRILGTTASRAAVHPSELA